MDPERIVKILMVTGRGRKRKRCRPRKSLIGRSKEKTWHGTEREVKRWIEKTENIESNSTP